MLHRQNDLRDDLQVAVHEHVERVRHDAFGRVLDRHHAVVRAVLADLGEDIGDGLLRGVAQAGAEAADGRLVGEGRLRPQVGNGQGLLQRQGAGHDLAVNRPQRLVGERPLVLPADPLQHRPLAVRRINLLAGLALHHLSEITDRAAKALENACRIAGVMAVIEGGINTKSISLAHLERGLVLVQWYLAETLRIRGAAIVPQSVLDAESLSKWLHSRNIKLFNTKPVLTHGPSQLRNKTRLLAAIGELVSNGYLAANEPGTVIDGIKTRYSWSVQHVV